MYMPTLHHPAFPQPIRTRSARYSSVLENMSVQSMDAKGTSGRSMEKASVSGTKVRAKLQNRQPLFSDTTITLYFTLEGGDG